MTDHITIPICTCSSFFSEHILNCVKLFRQKIRKSHNQIINENNLLLTVLNDFVCPHFFSCLFTCYCSLYKNIEIFGFR